MLYYALITLLIAKIVFSSGGSENNRLITGADVRTGDLLPSCMRVAVLSSGQRLRRRRALRDAGPCVNEALLQVDCVTDRRLKTASSLNAPLGGGIIIYV